MRIIFSSKGKNSILKNKTKTEGKKEIKIASEQGMEKYMDIHYKLAHVRS